MKDGDEEESAEQQESAESIVQIDEHNLDKECITLPSNYLKWAHQAAEAKRDIGEYKAELELVECEVQMEVRTHPDRFGLDKLTEAAVTTQVNMNPKCRAISRKLRKAEHAHQLAQAVVWAIECKKRALTLLVELHGMSYFATPKLSEKGREAVDKMTKRSVRHFRDDD